MDYDITFHPVSGEELSEKTFYALEKLFQQCTEQSPDVEIVRKTLFLLQNLKSDDDFSEISRYFVVSSLRIEFFKEFLSESELKLVHAVRFLILLRTISNKLEPSNYFERLYFEPLLNHYRNTHDYKFSLCDLSSAFREAGLNEKIIGWMKIDDRQSPGAFKWEIDELLSSSGKEVLLHGDLHHWNILSSEREGWLAIDPKGLAGEAECETGAFLRNPLFRILSAENPAEFLSDRID
jgi:hypothetical protein